MRFFKGHGLGNDYLAIDEGALDFALTPAAVRLICDRHRGLGSDGILVAVASERADFGLRILNPDGTEAEKSGNGLRIFGAYLLEQERIGERERFTVETPGGVVTLELMARLEDEVLTMEVEMGHASFRSADVGLRGPDREVVGERLELASGEPVSIHTVSMGNPHCVVFQDELEVEEMRRLGPQISAHPWFEHGTNVQFARANGPDALEALIWERGAGETLASGSSSCAVAAVAIRRGFVSSRKVQVRMPGGILEISVDEGWNVRMRGPVEAIFTAHASPDLLRRLRSVR